jgi:hypothetical protein
MAQWSHSDLTQIANAPLCAQEAGIVNISRPMGCVRADGVNTVVYTGPDGHIHQLHSSENKWVHTDLSSEPATRPDRCETAALSRAGPENSV